MQAVLSHEMNEFQLFRWSPASSQILYVAVCIKRLTM